jgi:6,7-dimethyl-8-ribityllumazine synthase
VTEEHWPGEDRIAATDEDDLRAELSEPEDEDEDMAEGENGQGEGDGEPAPPEEQLEVEEAAERRDGDTPAPDEPPAEEDELPRLRAPGHAPGELSVPDGYSTLKGSSDGSRRSVAVVVSRFNGEVTSRLLASALDELEFAGVMRDSVTVMPVPGAFELPLGAMALAKTRRFACVVALGCVIRGETPHFDYVAGEAASGLQLAALETGVPVSFGVLTLESADQADERVAKGAEAVRTALEMADLFAQLRASATA